MALFNSTTSTQSKYGDPIWFYYTAKTTGGSTITDTIVDGYVFALDQTNVTTTDAAGLGVAVTRPETAILNHFAGVAVNVPPGFTGPGRIQLIPAGLGISALTKSNMTKSTTFLAMANGLWSLATFSTFAALGDIAKVCALALETVDTSSTQANKMVQLRPFAGI